MGLGSSKPNSPPPTPPTAQPPRSGGTGLEKLPEAMQAKVFKNLGLDCRLEVQKSSVALATTAVPFESSKAYGLSPRGMRVRVRPLKTLQATLGLKPVALKPKSPVKKKTVKGFPQFLKSVHRFDPKTGKKMGKSTSMRGITVMWLKYPKGYKGKVKWPKAKNGVWAVRALGRGQKAGTRFGRAGRSGELMFFRED